MLPKLLVVASLALASGCISADFVSSQAMIYEQCNDTTSVQWGQSRSPRTLSTSLGEEVEFHCRDQAKIFFPLEKQLLRALENAVLIDNARAGR